MKKSILLHDIDVKLYEYLLLIPPDQKVTQKVNELKTLFCENYGCKNAAGLVPHLTLVNFMQQESMEFRLINCLEKFTPYVKPFPVKLEGFGQFPPHTIYLDLAERETIVALVKNIRAKFQRILRISEQLKPNFTLKPHLTIARGVTEEQYEKIWPVYQKEYFSESFTANEMILLKRETDPFTLKPVSKYRTVHHFPFLGKYREEQLAMAF